MPESSNNNNESKRRVSNTRHFRYDKYHETCFPKSEDCTCENIKQILKGKPPRKSIIHKNIPGCGKREVAKLVCNDMIRELIIPKEDNIKAAVFTCPQFTDLKTKSYHMTEKEKQEIINQIKDKKRQEATDSALRKKDLQQFDVIREHGTRLSELEEEADKRANHLLQRAFELRQEQEDEIKKCNSLILGTKCHAIRDAQIAEKILIEKELEEEEKRLEMMMEEERINAIRVQEKLKEVEVMKKKQFTNALLEQIKENEMQREMAAELIEEEAKLSNEAAMQIQLDELHAYEEKVKQQEKLRKEMNEINAQLRKISATEKEENRLADLKVQEFMKQKAEREKRREEEINEMKNAKEKELARLRALQQKASDVQAKKDEMNAQRVQDEVEREWRRKEKEAAMKRIEGNEEMKKARQKQVEDRRLCQAIEIQREKEETEKIAKVNQAALRREQEKQMRQLCSTDEHRMSLLKQINEKEKERIKLRQQMFQEGVAIKLEEKKRNEILRDTMAKKMCRIRSHNVPEQYVLEVEKQLKLNE